MSVRIFSENGRVSAETPYNVSFVSKVKNLGGRWNSANKTWSVDHRDEKSLRKLCIDIYGTDGSAATLAAPQTLKIRILRDKWNSTVDLCGLEIAKQWTRDSSTKIAANVIILEGGFAGGGSAKYPAANPRIGTVLEVRDIPESLAEKIRAAAAEANAAWEILEEDSASSSDPALINAVEVVAALSDLQRAELFRRFGAATVTTVKTGTLDEVSANVSNWVGEPVGESAAREVENSDYVESAAEGFDDNWAELLN